MFIISVISAQLVSHFYKNVIRASVFLLQSNFPPFSNLSTPDGEGNRVDLPLPIGPTGPRSKQMMEKKRGWGEWSSTLFVTVLQLA